MAEYLLKTDPDEYSFDDLDRERHTVWDGVANALAQRHMRKMREGDSLVIYHSGDERQAVGLAKVIRPPYPARSSANRNIVIIDILAGQRFPKPVSLEAMRQNPAFADFELLRNSRLSVVPMSAANYAEILRLAGLGKRR